MTRSRTLPARGMVPILHGEDIIFLHRTSRTGMIRYKSVTPPQVQDGYFDEEILMSLSEDQVQSNSNELFHAWTGMHGKVFRSQKYSASLFREMQVFIEILKVQLDCPQTVSEIHTKTFSSPDLLNLKPRLSGGWQASLSLIQSAESDTYL